MVYKPSFTTTQLVLQEDVLAAARYLEIIRKKTLSPEQRLMLAILENAIENFQKHVKGRTVRARKRYIEAEEWLMKDAGKGGFFSFENACETLRLNPEYVRKGLRDWKGKRCAGRSPMPRIKQGKAA